MEAAEKPYHHGSLAESLLLRAAEVIDEDGIEALTLRGIARDLGVSHGAPNRHFRNKTALLSALATEGWTQVFSATLSEADRTGSNNAHVRLNAMGRGYLRWALNHRALFRTIFHPEVNRQATPELKAAIDQFSRTIREAVRATQLEGRHPEVPLSVLAIFTNAVPTGAAVLLMDAVVDTDIDPSLDQEALIEQVINLVVPLPDDC